MCEKVVLICPTTGEPEYEVATKEFIKYYKAVTGRQIVLAENDDGESNLVLIGNSAVNGVVAKKVIDKQLPTLSLRTGTDDYAVKTVSFKDRKVLLLQGGMPRSTLYAVYEYFERLGCAWFWDGDIIKEVDSVKVWEKDFDVLKKQRFKYRGVRYFAHRGCKRFQAETWNFEDWKREIDYLAKRKMNTFMLRIGQDDLFQKAFPDTVGYPDESNMLDLCYPNSANFGGYDDRRLFWPLQFRGKLRKKVLSYAFDRGFIHPEDCGTMTHWYSMTPKDFIRNNKPDFYDDMHYGVREEGKVWDVSKDRSVEFYNALTKAHIKEYGKAQVFHTIGFAERSFGEDREKNFLMKKFVYDRFLQSLAKEYPNCPTFLASWDFWLSYKSEEVEKMLATFSKETCVLLDYTSDSPYQNNFTKWGVVNNFPYTFGIFSAYLSYNDCLGYYSLTKERLEIAKADEYCQGMVLWPELSHGDILAWEFFAQNAWGEEVVDVEQAIASLSKTRYGECGKIMQEIWELSLPIIELMHWTMRQDPYWNTEYYWYDLKMRYIPFLMSGKDRDKFCDGLDIKKAKAVKENALSCLEKATELAREFKENSFVIKDLLDIVRTIVGRYLNIVLILQADCLYQNMQDGKGEDKIVYYSKKALSLIDCVKDLLATSTEFSLYETLKDLEKTHAVYSGFMRTLKDNTEHPYCRTSVYETVKEVLIPELEFMQSMVLDCVRTKEYGDKKVSEFNNMSEQIVNKYMQKPFSETEREKTVLPLDQVIERCLDIFRSLDLD